MFPSPKRMFLTNGVGVHRHALTAFEFRHARRGYRAAEPGLCVVHSAAALRGYRPRRRGRVAQAGGYHLLRDGPVRDQRIRAPPLRQPRLGQTSRSGDVWVYIALHGYGMTAEASGEQAEDL